MVYKSTYKIPGLLESLIDGKNLNRVKNFELLIIFSRLWVLKLENQETRISMEEFTNQS